MEAVDQMLTTRQELLSRLTSRLLKAQALMKTHADGKRRDVSYNVGDWVYVKLRSYLQTSVSGSPYHKLAKRFYGPFQILEKIGVVAYRVQLPDSSKIHPVFHSSLLKLHQGPRETSHDPLPSVFTRTIRWLNL